MVKCDFNRKRNTMVHIRNRYFYLFSIFLLLDVWIAFAQSTISEKDFRTNMHPRVFVTMDDKQAIQAKIESVNWARDIYEALKTDVDPIIAMHQDNPGYVVSRMQMHWEPGKRYTHFYTEGNYVTRREGNAKYPTVRVTYGRAASNSVPLAPLDKIIPYGDGSLTKPASTNLGIVKLTESSNNELSDLGNETPYDTVPFTKTGLGTETVNRAFIQLAWKSSILYYLTEDKKYAKLAADILWNFVRGAAQQEQLNPGWEQNHKEGSFNGYLSFETLGDTRHFATLPFAYDMIYDYLRQEYFDSEQFVKGIDGEMWAPPHPEGKEWALGCFEKMFKRLIENKLNRGGGLKGNWNMNEQQSAMLYALALDEDFIYQDGKGRAYYVNKLVYGPTTEHHGAYLDVLRANISPTTGLWPEAPGGYGQGSIGQLVRFGFIYYKNGLDFLSKDPLLSKASSSMTQMLFPNGYVTNFGDATYATMNTEQLELMMAYWHDKKDGLQERKCAEWMKYAPQRNLHNEFYYALFFYLPEIPRTDSAPQLARTSYSETYSLVFGRNDAPDPKDALAFTLMGFGKDTGHRQPNGMNMELYGRGYILAPDQGVGQDYWGADTHEYKINVAGHNTVSPNGKGADNNMPQNLEIVHAEPVVIDGKAPDYEVSPYHQYVDAVNHFHTSEIKAEQRRMLSIIHTSPHTGYYVDIFRSDVTDGEDRYHDYIYHNMGTGSEFFLLSGQPMPMSASPLDSLSGKGYSYFTTLGSCENPDNFYVDYHLGIDDTHMRMFVPTGKGRTVYQLNSLFNHRYYEPSLRTLPVPALLIRQKSEAWDHPFIAVYEPYGNGAKSQIRSVYTSKTPKQKGVAKLSVEYFKKDKMDHIIHSVNEKTEAKYMGIRFMGTYCVVTMEKGRLVSLYIGNGYSFSMDGLEVTLGEGKPFDAWLEWRDGEWICHSREAVKIKMMK